MSHGRGPRPTPRAFSIGPVSSISEPSPLGGEHVDVVFSTTDSAHAAHPASRLGHARAAVDRTVPSAAGLARWGTVAWRGAERLRRELAKFGLVGLVAFVVDVGIFNFLRFGVDGTGALVDKPLTAKAISVVLATTVAYFGNRHWTFRHRGRTSFRREYLLFFLLNGVAMIMSLGCLYISHYALGFTSGLADNISANGVGLVLGTLFRFWSYRRWVFPETAQASMAAVV